MFFTKKKPKNELMSRPGDMYYVVAGLVSIPHIIPDKDP